MRLRVALVVIALLAACGAAHAVGIGPPSAGPGGVEAVASSSTTIDIYLPARHGELTIMTVPAPIVNAPANARKVTVSGLRPETGCTFIVAGLEDGPVTVSEATYPVVPTLANFDLIVVGATASGTAAAVSAARMGANVALVEETGRAGGMLSSGLGNTDIGSGSRANGFFEEFRQIMAAHYGNNGLKYEPRVANAVMKSMIYAEPHLTFFRQVRAVGLVRSGGRIAGIEVQDLLSGTTGKLLAPLVIDATVEADVAAAAGVKSRIPREARSDEERHAGVIYWNNSSQQFIEGSTGEADHRVQSYAYLMVLKNYPGQDRSIPEPPGYKPDNYRYSPRWGATWATSAGRLPNGKFEVNQHPWGTDLPGINYDYPTATPERRAQIAVQYRDRALGYLYYLQNEQGLKSLALADDEFPENGNFPPILYVRESRRMVGKSTMKETDVRQGRKGLVPDSIGIGDYPMDSHAVREPTDPDSGSKGEGEFFLSRLTPWYRVPVGVIVPERTPGLLVSTAVSATHVGYGTLRMEPVRMSLGQAAGTVAALSLRYRVDPSQMPVSILQDRLLLQKSYLTWFPDVDGDTPHFTAIQFMAVKGVFQAEQFRPEDDLTHAEARTVMDRLLALETGKTASESGSPSEWPITRGEFARMLVETKMKVDPDWAPRPVEARHYVDLDPNSEVAAFAETLYRHHIDARAWDGPSWDADGGFIFRPGDPITRADAAQAVFLAHRAIAMRFEWPKSE